MSKIIGQPVFSSEGSEIITIDDIKEHLYIDSGNSTFDTVLTNLRKEVRQWIEQVTCLSLITRTVTVIIDYDEGFTIPFAPVTSFTSASIKTDINEYTAEVLNDEYEVEHGRFISYTGNWRYKLVYVAGYTSATLPHGLKLAFLNEVARRFENRGDNVIVSDTNELLNPYKLFEWVM